MKKLLFLLSVFFVTSLYAQVEKVEPTFWWVGMKNPNLQLLVYGKDIAKNQVSINYPGVKITKVNKVANPNYLFIDLSIDSLVAKAGKFNITFLQNNKKFATYQYELKSREQASANREGFNSGDVIYEIMPDRFVNGDTKNDFVKGYPDGTDRQNPDARHGGDLQGIINNLDYISSMGYTALWLTPVVENNAASTSYHGYATTDYYKIDPRHGSNELYKKLAEECKKRNIKLIIDYIVNHSGKDWWIYKDLPSNDWINNYPDMKICNFRGTTVFDPHKAEIDAKGMSDGWFAESMPDLNQRNQFLATYLIQNSIWWIEYAGLSGVRSDTHQYPDKQFVSEWAKQILAEYPHFNMVGEVWLNYPSMTSYWQKDAPNLDKYNSNLPTIMDFPLHNAIPTAFAEGDGWGDTGMNRLYDIFSQDFLMANPMNIMIFGDNHDTSRFYTLIKEDFKVYKLAMAFLLTTRGIPQMYAGTEALMTGVKGSGDGVMRKDFPGGWAEDKVSIFTRQGLTNDQIEALDYMKRIQNWRKTNDAVKYGTMTQFAPQNGVYVYFRIKGDKKVMVILNNNKEKQELQTIRFAECLGNHRSGTDIISENAFNWTDKIEVPAKAAMIIDLN